jgi:hypothetical protein
VKRQLIEALVGGIRIDTCEEDGKRCASVAVAYRFASSVDTCTGRGSCNERDSSIKVECRAGMVQCGHPCTPADSVAGAAARRWRIYGIGLPDDVLRKVYYANALRYVPAARATVERRLAAGL